LIRIPDVCRLSYFHVFCRFPRISAYPLSGPPRAPLSTPSPPPPDRPPKTHRRHMGVGRTFTRATGETAQGVSVRGAAVAPLRVASRQVRASLRVGPPQSGHPRLGGGSIGVTPFPPPRWVGGRGVQGKNPGRTAAEVPRYPPVPPSPQPFRVALPPGALNHIAACPLGFRFAQALLCSRRFFGTWPGVLRTQSISIRNRCFFRRIA